MKGGQARRYRWLSAGIVLVVLALTAFVVYRQWDAIRAFPWRLHAGYLVLAALAHAVSLGTTFWVWHLMVRRLSGFGQARASLHIYYVSTLAKRVPSALPYIGGRVAMYQAVGVPGSIVLSAIVLENVLIGVGGVLTLLAVLPFYSEAPPGMWVIGAVGLLLLAVFLLRPGLLIEAANRLLRRLGRAVIERAPTRRDILTWTGLYVLPWLTAGVAFYCVLRAFTEGPAPGMVDSLAISTITMLVALASIVMPSGLGLKEITGGVLMSTWMPFSTAVIISLAYRLLQIVNELTISILSYWFLRPAGDDYEKSAGLSVTPPPADGS